MSVRRVSVWAALVAVIVSQPVLPHDQSVGSVTEGHLMLKLNIDLLQMHGLEIGLEHTAAVQEHGTLTVGLTLASSPDVVFTTPQDAEPHLRSRTLRTTEGVTLTNGLIAATVLEFSIFSADDSVSVSRVGHDLGGRSITLELRDVKTGLHRANGVFRFGVREVVISSRLAAALARSDLAGTSIGSAEFTASARMAAPRRPSPTLDHDDGGGSSPAGNGPDMTFCTLYALGQYGRGGDIVGLSVATTSWNVGTDILPWLGIPAPNHPFIVWDLFRLNVVDGSERFEQIGQSWVKHGFCALDSEQCGTTCINTGCASLGVGCTDTYSAGLNASQGALGPRLEINPWERGWMYQGSHYQAMGGIHGGTDGIQHRLQVHDADLEPALNPGATYYSTGYYICPEDVDEMNNGAWRKVLLSGSSGGEWDFTMSGPIGPMHVGFPIDAWSGATQTLLAQQIPCVEFLSPDGRCLLGAQATDLGGGTWHYEYALYNIDMDRQVGSFTIPISADINVTDVGFHAVEHHDEYFNTVAADAVPIDNAPWNWLISDHAITWSTTSNPLRWGTLYNFRFDADQGPTESTVTLGLFRPGTPKIVTGQAIGPVLGAGACATIAHCADLDQNGLRDDSCTWWNCVAEACDSSDIPFADVGGQAGACPPDGAVDANDRFHALNCFANQDTAGIGSYPCEDYPPTAFNVDAGGPFGQCCPDGVCDGNDAFHAIHVFEDVNPCMCPANFVCPCPNPTEPADNPVLCPPGPAPQAGHGTLPAGPTAHLTLRSVRRVIRPGEPAEVEVFLDDALPDLRGYQLHVRASGGSRGNIELADIAVVERKDGVFANKPGWRAFNVRTGQMAVGLDDPGVPTHPTAYLATLTFKASRDAAGRFVIELLHDHTRADQRTFLFLTEPGLRINMESTAAVLEISGVR